MSDKRASRILGGRLTSMFHSSHDSLVSQPAERQRTLDPKNTSATSIDLDTSFYFEAPANAKSPRRKPPPADDGTQLEEMPSLSGSSDAHDRFHDLMVSLDQEIHQLAEPIDNASSLDNSHYHYGDTQLSPERPAKPEETSPLPDPQHFLFTSPGKSLDPSRSPSKSPQMPSPNSYSDSSSTQRSLEELSDVSLSRYESDGRSPAPMPVRAPTAASAGTTASADSFRALRGPAPFLAPYPIGLPVGGASPVLLTADLSTASTDLLVSPAPPRPLGGAASLHSVSSNNSVNSHVRTPFRPSFASTSSQSSPHGAAASLASAASTQLPPFMLRPLDLVSTAASVSTPKTMGHHRKLSSISSLLSSKSGRNVNLAAIKKTLNLNPGEGVRSNYVANVRRSAGTAYNESGPGKWKLPTGIQPIDKASTSKASNGRYMRLAGSHSHSRTKKVSGVELKHGHLAPRLLATEANDTESTKTRSSLGTESTKLPPPETNRLSTGSSMVGLRPMSVTSSLVRSDTVSSATSSISKRSRSNSASSSSSGSIIDTNVGVGYYQHPGYRYDDEIEETENDSVDETLANEEEEPRLVLANPDDSD